MLPLATCFVVWWSIWCRRYTWPFRWERATSLGTGLLGIATLLTSPPVYSIAFELYENGISRALMLDYNDFSIRGELTSIDIRDTKPCN